MESWRRALRPVLAGVLGDQTEPGDRHGLLDQPQVVGGLPAGPVDQVAQLQVHFGVVGVHRHRHLGGQPVRFLLAACGGQLPLDGRQVLGQLGAPPGQPAAAAVRLGELGGHRVGEGGHVGRAGVTGGQRAGVRAAGPLGQPGEELPPLRLDLGVVVDLGQFVGQLPGPPRQFADLAVGAAGLPPGAHLHPQDGDRASAPEAQGVPAQP